MSARERNNTKINRSEEEKEVGEVREVRFPLCWPAAPSVPLPSHLSAVNNGGRGGGPALGEGLRLRENSIKASLRFTTFCPISAELCWAKQCLKVGGSRLWAQPVVYHHERTAGIRGPPALWWYPPGDIPGLLVNSKLVLLHATSHWCLITPSGRRYCNQLHFTGKENKAQRGSLTFLTI